MSLDCSPRAATPFRRIPGSCGGTWRGSPSAQAWWLGHGRSCAGAARPAAPEVDARLMCRDRRSARCEGDALAWPTPARARGAAAPVHGPTRQDVRVRELDNGGFHVEHVRLRSLPVTVGRQERRLRLGGVRGTSFWRAAHPINREQARREPRAALVSWVQP